MPHDEQSKNQDDKKGKDPEVILDRRKTVDRRRVNLTIRQRPFPLAWGLSTLALLVAIFVIVQLQFNASADEALQAERERNDEAVYNAHYATYEEVVKVYDAALADNRACLNAIEVRDTYRKIFDGVSELFQLQADMPVSLFPESEAALQYQLTITKGIVELIQMPVEEGLPPRKIEDCKPIPTEKPKPPVKPQSLIDRETNE